MKSYYRGFGILVLGIAVVSLSACATSGTSYRRELSRNPRLSEANTSYRKAVSWVDKARSSLTAAEAQESYTTAGSYLSDAIFKLKESGHDKDIDVSEDLYYCEKMKSDIDVKIGAATKAR